MRWMTMGQMVLSSSALIAAVVALRFALGRFIGRGVRYAMWGLVLLRLLLPFTFFSAPAGILNSVDLAPVTILGAHRVPVFPYGTQTGPYYTDELTEDGTIIPYAGEREPLTTTLVWLELSVAQLLRILWCVGAVVMALRFLFRYSLFRKKLLQMRVRADVDCKLPVFLADLPDAPCLFGVLRPAIYLTPQVARDAQATGHILSHETAHFAHGDHIWAVLRSVCLVVYWFHPLVWLAAALSRVDCELACDAAAVRTLGAEARMAYGRTLVDVIACRTASASLLNAATTMHAGVRGIKRRLELIVQNRPPIRAAVVALAVLLAVAIALTFTGVTPKNSVVRMYVRKETITPSGATFVLDNATNEDYLYGEPNWVQRKGEDGAWMDLDPTDTAFFMVGYRLPAGEQREKTWTWGGRYGALPPGEYRLVTDVIRRTPGDYDRYTLYGEFKVPAP